MQAQTRRSAAKNQRMLIAAAVRQASPLQAQATAALGFAVLRCRFGNAIEMIDGVEW
ncbi:hypothetical protein LL972_08195 [Xanthomonas campestris pv. asclepiadis]|uniref:hypothetical protein n=1 Tax=Xanthomonas campestris TaxID=339 RepID=UPI001E29B637|nr:hypothetical protein [Xanthomonas campestris]MCC4615984.1 hypothetical protein [Xanthomonas campestris pv. asclepiadis]